MKEDDREYYSPYDQSQDSGAKSNSNNPYSYNPGEWNQMGELYKNLLGRSGDPNEYASHFVNGKIDPNAYWNIYNSPEATKYRASQTQGGADNGSQINMPAGIDPRLAQLYQKYGLTPGGSGSGFADWQYWQNKAGSAGWDYILGRLGANLAGNGMDNPQGTPGSGSWSSSGRAGGAVSSSSSTPIPGAASAATSDPDLKNLIAQLTKRANQSLSIDPNTDPVIHPQVDNFAASQERSRRNYLNDLAESNSPYSTGAARTAATQTSEAAGQQTAALQAQLVANELQNRRTEIQNSLSELGSVLTAKDQLALQNELGQLDAQLRKLQIDSGNDQFAANLGLEATDRANYWDWLRSGGQ